MVAKRMHGKAIDFIEDLHCIHKLTHDHLIASIAKYKLMADRHCCLVEFEIGDKVWVVLTKDRFPLHEFNKLKAWKIGPLEMLQKVNPNAYRLRLPDGLRTSNIFNVKHLVPFIDDSYESNSRTNLSQPEENDGVYKNCVSSETQF